MTDLFTIAPIKEEDVENVMNFLKRTFFVDEPLNEAVELCKETGTCPELEEYCKHSLLTGLSFKALDKDGNIVGVTISGIAPLKEDTNGNDLQSQAEKCRNPKFQKILYILAQRESGAKLWEKYPDDKNLVEVKVAATDPGWRKKGIMNRLMEETELATKQIFIRLLRLDTSSAYSAMAAERLGFVCVYSVYYKEITMNEKPLIVPKPPHLEDKVYIKQISRIW